MKNDPYNFDAIKSLEQRDLEKIRQMSLAERGELLISVCRSAAEIEASRAAMGFPPTEPDPWPESTWKFLAECMRRVWDAKTDPASHSGT
jgi:hypothetical protein